MSISLSTQDVGFSYTLNGRVWRWKTRMDVSGLAPVFQVVDIVTPFGVFRDSVPLPGEVVQAMGGSITTLVSNFKATILLGPPTPLVFNVDEGRGFSSPVSGRVTNTGVFGSLLSTTLIPSAAYVTVTPEVVGNLVANAYGLFDVAVDSTDLLSAYSPYSASVSVVDAASSNSLQIYPITINVRPMAVVSTLTSTVTFSASRPLSGPYSPIPTQTFTVQNTGPSGSVLEYQIAKLTNLSQNWLSGAVPISGTLCSGGQQIITVSVSPITGLMPGVYTETLRISGYSLNGYTDVLVQLTIT